MARLAVAAVLGLAAVRWPRLAPAAVILSLPVVWIASLSILVATFAPVPAEATRRVGSPFAWARTPRTAT